MWLGIIIPVVNHHQSTTSCSYFLKRKSSGETDSALRRAQAHFNIYIKYKLQFNIRTPFNTARAAAPDYHNIYNNEEYLDKPSV